MKKLALLAGTLGSTAAWYVLSNKKLRTELGKAKSPEETVQILTKYLGRDASKIGKEVHEFIQSEEVQGGLSKAKKGLGGLLAKGKEAKDAAMKKMKKEKQ